MSIEQETGILSEKYDGKYIIDIEESINKKEYLYSRIFLILELKFFDIKRIIDKTTYEVGNKISVEVADFEIYNYLNDNFVIKTYINYDFTKPFYPKVFDNYNEFKKFKNFTNFSDILENLIECSYSKFILESEYDKKLKNLFYEQKLKLDIKEVL